MASVPAKKPPPPRPRHPGVGGSREQGNVNSFTIVGVDGVCSASQASRLLHGCDAGLLSVVNVEPQNESRRCRPVRATFASSEVPQRERLLRRCALCWVVSFDFWFDLLSDLRMWSGRGGSWGGGVGARNASLDAFSRRDFDDPILRRKPIVPGRTRTVLVWVSMGRRGQRLNRAKRWVREALGGRGGCVKRR